MLPADLALPDKFERFRKGQEDLAVRIASSDARFRVLSAPTGSGKSLIYMAAARILGGRVLVLTSTKGLQGQLIGDFESIGLRDIRGQGNYPCIALDSEKGHLTTYGTVGGACDDAPCHVGVHCSLRSAGCYYYDAVAAAARAPMVITNYAYWMTVNESSDPRSLGEFTTVVLDEAHAAPDLLANFCSITIDPGETRKLLQLEVPTAKDDLATWARWARDAFRLSKDLYVPTDASNTRKALKLRRLRSSLAKLASVREWRRGESSRNDPTMPGRQPDWVIERRKDTIRFSPVWAHGYAESLLFCRIPNVVLSSSVIRETTMRYLGVDPSDVESFDAGSTFHPGRRPLVYIPTVKVDRNMVEGQVRMWVNRIDAIIEKHGDEKGIVHTRSYVRAKAILERSRNKDRLIGHQYRGRDDAIRQFRQERGPAVLVSPSLEEGYDFAYDDCRFQIIAKVPFIDTRPPVVKARVESDKDYQNYMAALSIIQASGRGMRSADDRCVTYIVDDHWHWFRMAAKEHFPGWFRRAWRQRRTV